MNIGIDMDDTITCTSEMLEIYSKKYALDNNITEEELWNIIENKINFLKKYLQEIYEKVSLKDGVKKAFEELKTLGYKIYIITARTTNYVDDIVKLINNYLEQNDLKVDGVFINGKDKIEICKNNNINIMIDDSIYNYQMLTKNNIKVILFDEKNEYEMIDNKVQNWYQIIEFINNQNIVFKMKNEIIQRSNNFELLTKGTKDEYNLYREHIQYVYKYAVMIAKNKEVDLEIIELSALLHDISMTDKELDRSKHNEYGAEIAINLLTKEKYPKDKIDLIAKCILNHSSKRKEYRTTLEENILVDADAMAHFDCIQSLYTLANKVMGLNEEESINFVKEKLTKDYKEISDDVKYLIEDKYKRIMIVNNITELMNI